VQFYQWPANSNTKNLLLLIKDINDEIATLGPDMTPELSIPVGVLRRSQNYFTNSKFRSHVNEKSPKIVHLEQLKATKKRYEYAIHRFAFDDMKSESGELDDGPISSEVIETFGNVTDVSGETASMSRYAMGLGTEVLSDENLDLNKFLSRPIQLLATVVPNSTDFDVDIPVWQTYFSNPTVRAKLRNYAFIRADLKVRIAISGTPFHYGRLQATYVPFADLNPVTAAYSGTAAARPNFLKYLSTVTGSQTLNVKDNQPLDIHIPYLNPMPMIRLFNNSNLAITDSTTFTDTDHMGNLFIKTLNQVQCISDGTPTSVSIYVYAWLENVKLGCPTGTVLQITTESGMISESGDERKTGPIQWVASRVRQVSKSLENVPFMRPWAIPSTMVASGIERFSALMGWSMPVLTTTPTRMQNEPLQNACLTIGSDTGHRMTLDPKQELTVDPRFLGIMEDELLISNIASHQSLFYTFSWDPTDVPLSSPIFQAFVSPTANSPLLATSSTQDTALSFAAIPFKYWRGTIKYTFDVVKSQFHRGKIAIIYEPNCNQRTLINSALDLNKQYVKIVDIQETDTFDICVDWAYPRAWAQVAPPVIGDTFLDPTTSGPSVADYCNGYICIVPINKLQSPDDSSVAVNVYVSSDDIVFNRFTEESLPKLLTVDGMVSESGTINDTPLDKTCFTLNPTGAKSSHLSEDFFGEMPISFRTLLKRFFASDIQGLEPSGCYWGIRYTGSILPPEPVLNTASTYVSLYNYLRLAFIGQRGSLRKRYRMIIKGGDQPLTGHIKVNLARDSSTTAVPTVVGLDSSAPTGMYPIMDGSTAFVPSTNAGVEFEIPFYSNNLFVFSSMFFNDVPSTQIQSFLRNYYVTYDYLHDGSPIQLMSFEETATGEDFMFAGFLAPPPRAVL